MIAIEAILILLWVGIAGWHAHLIKNNRPIQHGWWGLLSAFFIVAASWIYGIGHPLWQIGLFAGAQACLRLVVFNICLNLFRGNKWYYASHTTSSIIDRIEIVLFGNRVWLIEGILFLLFMLSQFFL